MSVAAAASVPFWSTLTTNLCITVLMASACGAEPRVVHGAWQRQAEGFHRLEEVVPLRGGRIA